MHQGDCKTVCKIQKLANALKTINKRKNNARKENNIEYQQFNKMSFEKTFVAFACKNKWLQRYKNDKT
jgi:hypothetical protein